MKKIFIYKFLISIFLISFIFVQKSFAEPVFVSLSPALTEIMYALGADDILKAVSSECKTPENKPKKDVIGNNYFVNTEKLLKIKPDYILAFDSSENLLAKYKKFGIIPLCLKYPDVDSIYENILYLGKLTGKNNKAKFLVNYSKNINNQVRTKKSKKILYLVSTEPMITIGNKSFITDVIKKSGNVSITQNLNYYYPVISEEFCIIQKPDVVVVGLYSNKKRIEKLFPDAKIVVLSKEQNDIINQPGYKVHESITFFAKL